MVHSDLTEAPKHDAKNIVFFIQKACIENEMYQHNSLYYNLINIFLAGPNYQPKKVRCTSATDFQFLYFLNYFPLGELRDRLFSL